MSTYIVTKGEMAEIREGKGLPKVENKKNQIKNNETPRMKMISKLKKLGIAHKGNASNAELEKLLGDK